MPLKADLDGSPIIAPLLDDRMWLSIRDPRSVLRGRLRTPCCGEMAYPRVSKLGTRHFVHKKRGGCESNPETPEHLFLKSELALGCHDAGYDVETEASGPAWRADVLATRGKARIALEIQWSRQTAEETALRQARYAESGIGAAWIFRKVPRGLELRSDLPAFAVQLNDSASATIEGMPVREFGSALLSGRFKLCERVRLKMIQPIRIVFAEDKCWKCKRRLHVFAHSPGDNQRLEGAHGSVPGDTSAFWNGRIEHHPMIRMAIRDFQRTSDGEFLCLGDIKRRWSEMRGRPYVSQGCPYCDSLFGDWFLFAEAERWIANRVAELTVLVELKRPTLVRATHWCYSDIKRFCVDD